MCLTENSLLVCHASQAIHCPWLHRNYTMPASGTNMHTLTHTYTYKHTYTHAHTHIHTHAHTYTHTNIQTRTHTHTHTHTQGSREAHSPARRQAQVWVSDWHLGAWSNACSDCGCRCGCSLGAWAEHFRHYHSGVQCLKLLSALMDQCIVLAGIHDLRSRNHKRGNAWAPLLWALSFSPCLTPFACCQALSPAACTSIPKQGMITNAAYILCMGAHTQLVVEKRPPQVCATPEVPGLQALIQECLVIEPRLRPSADEVVQVGLCSCDIVCGT